LRIQIKPKFTTKQKPSFNYLKHKKKKKTKKQSPATGYFIKHRINQSKTHTWKASAFRYPSEQEKLTHKRLQGLFSSCPLDFSPPKENLKLLPS
jgi:hypothetical protein